MAWDDRLQNVEADVLGYCELCDLVEFYSESDKHPCDCGKLVCYQCWHKCDNCGHEGCKECMIECDGDWFCCEECKEEYKERLNEVN